MSVTSGFSSALAELASRFAEQLPLRIKEIRLVFEQIAATGRQQDQMAELHRLVHSLTGTAGTFGMGPLSDAARQLESRLTRILTQAGVPDDETWSAVQTGLAQLEQLALTFHNSNAPSLAPFQAAERSHQPLIYLVEDNEDQAKYLEQRLMAQDCRVRTFSDLASFRSSWDSAALPDALVMDMVFPEGDAAGAQVVAELRAAHDIHFPVVFISVRDDIEAHIAAYRAGATRFLTKPVDAGRLSRLLRELIGNAPLQPYRVLLVDDDPLLVEVHAVILRNAGMEAYALSDPLKTLEAVREFHPDVVVLDVYMPAASGPELAAVLREHDAYAYLPILFLSVETDLSKQLLALDLGGDDFLVKPINPEHLVTAVTARAHRSRQSNEMTLNLKRILYEREREHLALDHHAIVSATDVAGRIIYANDKFCAISGYAREELIGQNHRMVKSDEHAPEFYAELWRTISSGHIWNGLICNKRKDGSRYWVEATITPFLDAGGKPYQYVAIRTDITALKQSEQRWSFALEGSGDGVWDWDLQTGAVMLSKMGKAMFGLADNEVGNHISEWNERLHPEDQLLWQEKLRNFFRSKADKLAIEYRVRCKDGGYKWILTRGMVASRSADDRVLRMTGVHTDISQRKRDEERLELFGHIFGATPRAIGVADGNGKMIYINPAYERMYGYSQEELIGKDFAIFIPEETRRSIPVFMAAIRSGGTWSGPLPQRRKDGSEFISASSIGGILDEHGAPRFVFNIAYDCTPELEREEELRIARDKAESANQAKSDFLSHMSHELRTPLNAILGFSQLLESDAGLDPDQQDNVHEIMHAGQHLLELINEVLDLARIESGQVVLSLEPSAVATLIDECCSLMKPLAEKRAISLLWDNWDEVMVCADRVRFKQVLLNLLSNAIKYNREQGSIRVTRQHLRPGYMRIAVSDSGPGIAAERINELFQPFNRLGAEHGAVEGTGIGLTITRKLVEMMGGSIGVESTLGVGSTFWVELPEVLPDMAAPRINAARPDATKTAAPTQTHCMLYVEDNPSNLKLVSQIMASRPHIRLITAHTPELGIELALAYRPELIVLDINMPGLDGYQVLTILQADAVLQDVPVIALTANAQPRDIEHGMQAGFAAYLTKPLDVERFLQAVDDMLLKYPQPLLPEKNP